MRVCERCKKTFKMGGTRRKLRGKFNPTNWSAKRANLQLTRLLVKSKRSLVCTKCLRTLTKKTAK